MVTTEGANFSPAKAEVKLSGYRDGCGFILTTQDISRRADVFFLAELSPRYCDARPIATEWAT